MSLWKIFDNFIIFGVRESLVQTFDFYVEIDLNFYNLFYVLFYFFFGKTGFFRNLSKSQFLSKNTFSV